MNDTRLADAAAQLESARTWAVELENQTARLNAELKKERARYAELDKVCDQVMTERDHMYEVADQLAYAVAPIEDIGEHSSENDPWENALDRITSVAEVDQLRAQLTAIEAMQVPAQVRASGIGGLALGYETALRDMHAALGQAERGEAA